MIEVLRTGLYSSIQDFGRMGYQHLGIPIGGAMDHTAMHEANALLDNPKNSAVLEMSFQGPKLLFHQPLQIALAGATMEIQLNGKKIKPLNLISVEKNETLEFGNVLNGKRTYLAVEGGFQSETVLGSQSQYEGVTKYATLRKNEILNTGGSTQKEKSKNLIMEVTKSFKNLIPVYKGPDYALLSEKEIKRLTSELFTISVQNSRMAYVLEEKLTPHEASLWTGPVMPGTVQYTPNGSLIILMRDAQTTGGYPRILQLSDEGINCLAQKSTRDPFQFELVEI